MGDLIGQAMIFGLGAFTICMVPFLCYVITLRLIITLFSLDVRNLSPRLQALVMLDGLILHIILGWEDTPYTASIRTGLSLEELKEQDDD